MVDVDYVIDVKTGDKLFSGTDANVYVKLHSHSGGCSEEKLLDCFFKNDLETGQTDRFKHKRQTNLPSVDYIALWRDDAGILDNWYVDFIRVTNTATNQVFEFPIFRWIKAGMKYRIAHLDTSLPQADGFIDQRKLELEDKRSRYEVTTNITNGPAQVQP